MGRGLLHRTGWDNPGDMQTKVLLERCAELVGLVLVFEHPADAVVSRFFRVHRGLGVRERAVLADAVYSVLRQRLLFEHLAASGSGPRERRLAILGLGGARDFLKGALSDQEKRWLDRCDADRADALSDRLRHNLPEWLLPLLEAQSGRDGFWPLVAGLSCSAPLDLRVNVLKGKRAGLQEELARAGVEARPTPYSPWGLRVVGKPALARVDAFRRGAVEVQDEGAQLLALLLDAGRGELVVDFCAGAGGKTLAIGAGMRNTGRLYAFDTSAQRLDALKPRLARSGLSNVHPAALAHERDGRVERLTGKIDRVLVDAPCSGLGTLRRNPDLKWRQSARAVAELAARQAAIVRGAARLLKPGGRLVYATCSILPEENEAIAQAFDAAQPGFDALDAGRLLEQLKVPEARRLCSGGESGSAYLRLWPHLHQTDGFFAAVWRRKV